MSPKRIMASLLLGIVFLLPGATVSAGTQLDAPTIKAALRTTEKEDNGFVDRVVTQMQKDVRLRRIVTGVFLQARQRPRNRFQYFKYGVIQLAAKEGITVK